MNREKSDEILMLTSTRYIEQKEYWINQLAGDFTGTEISFAGKRSSHTGNALERLEMIFSARLSRQLLHLSHGDALTIYVILLAGLKALIYRCTGNQDITLIAPVYGTETSGQRMNHLVYLRDAVHGETTFKELVTAVSETLLDAYENQDYPAGKLIEYLVNNSLVNTAEISNIACLLRNIHGDGHVNELKAGLVFSMACEDERIRGHLFYDPGMYSGYFAGQIASYYTALLEVASKNVDVKISGICFLAPEEKNRLLFGFNNTGGDSPGDKTIHHLFEKHSAVTPDRIAIVFEENRLTYRVLNEKANRLARRLRSGGIGTDRLVGVLLHRSLEMAAAILAAWKAGGAYIPIEPTCPTARMIEILKDSRAGVLVTRPAFVDPRLQDAYEGILILEDNNNYDNDNPNVPMDMNGLAYIIYTSGSTGKPKGAMVEHTGMMNHIRAKIGDFHLTHQDIVAQNASHTFDISVWQFFAALVVGGKTIIYPYELILEPGSFITLLNRHRVTVLEVVPSYLSVMLDIPGTGSPAPPLALKVLLVTGEEIKPSLVQRWFDAYPHIKMANVYGPTEASDDITHYIMEKAPGMERIPIGKPLPNLYIYIVDNDMNLCPVGVAGEIWVAGAGVGRGYVNDSQRTQEVFMEDPFAGDRGIRVYKTGDLGYRLPDGTVEFLGRKDYQVKIRGLRIELGEIESELLKVDGIKAAAAAVKQDRKGNKCLCAYFVPQKKLNIPEIEKYLSAHLPGYMVPAHFVELTELPLTQNGKINRKKLDAMDIEITKNDTLYEPPANEIEKKLVDIWSRVLGIEKEKIGVNHDFFKTGGDSLKAIKIAAAAARENIPLNLADLFQYTTIKGAVKNLKPAKKKASQEEVSGEILLLPLQQKILSMDNPHPQFWNVIFASDIADQVDPELLEKSLDKLVEHHDALRINFIDENGQWKQINREYRDVDFHMRCVAVDNTDPDEMQNEIRDYIYRMHCALNLEKDLLIRAVVFDLGKDGKKLFISIHHFICDLVSIQILVEDLAETYFKFLHRLEIKMNPKTTSYMEWAAKLYSQIEPGGLDLSYWQNLDIKQIDHLVPPGIKNNKAADMTSFLSVLSEEDTRALKAAASGEYDVSIEVILLSALVVSLHDSSNLNNCLIEVESHGREPLFDDADLSRTIGWFTNEPPVVLPYKGDIRGTVESTAKILRNLPYRGIYYNIVKYIFNGDIPGLTPRIVFNYQGEYSFENNADEGFQWLFKSKPTPGNNDKAPAGNAPAPLKDFILREHPNNYIPHVLMVSPSIRDSQIQVIFSFSRKYLEPGIIDGLPKKYIAVLKKMTAVV